MVSRQHPPVDRRSSLNSSSEMDPVVRLGTMVSETTKGLKTVEI